jgi:protein TonB
MRSRSTLGSSLVVSLCGHALLGLGLLWVIGLAPDRGSQTAVTPKPFPASIVWLDRAGSAGSLGGGGDETPAPARAARRPGTDRLTAPAAPRPDPLKTTPTPPPPSVGLDIPAVSLAAALDSLTGTIRTPSAAPTDSLGSGKRGGAGEGEGIGDGPGIGDRMGRTPGQGAGDGPYRMGSGVTPPIPLYRGAPRYTSEAVQARVQGSILVECIVQTTGRCTDARVVRSMQPPFGLDREAIAAAGEWRFKPGLHAGEQVPVLVTIEVAFSIR